jgi:hypothetical protein
MRTGLSIGLSTSIQEACAVLLSLHGQAISGDLVFTSMAILTRLPRQLWLALRAYIVTPTNDQFLDIRNTTSRDRLLSDLDGIYASCLPDMYVRG